MQQSLTIETICKKRILNGFEITIRLQERNKTSVKFLKKLLKDKPYTFQSEKEYVVFGQLVEVDQLIEYDGCESIRCNGQIIDEQEFGSCQKCMEYGKKKKKIAFYMILEDSNAKIKVKIFQEEAAELFHISRYAWSTMSFQELCVLVEKRLKVLEKQNFRLKTESQYENNDMIDLVIVGFEV